MMACERGPAPVILELHADGITRNYIAKRQANPSYRFHWPQRDGQSVYEAVKAALEIMTDRRCAYCDAHPIAAMGEVQIDHFRPKSREPFYDLVCAWDNLFLICSACNKAKRDEWDDALLRPDERDFSFSRFFSYRTDTGALEPNAAATSSEQHRARRTIDIIDLNRPDACVFRRAMVKRIVSASSEDDLADLAYRYLIALCRES